MSVDLSRFPRVPLGVWPTPLEECARLSDRLGPRILLKRDDVNGLGAGGNKLRKLEFLLGDALAHGADTVITFGALQTNHGRQTAAACARLGLRCELVLTAKVPRSGVAYTESGNLALDRLFGATVHECGSADEAAEVLARLRAEPRDEGRTVAEFPTGGSSGTGALGYVAAAEELLAQLAVDGVQADRIVVPQGSGGTAAGLAVGLELLGWPGELSVACVAHHRDESIVDFKRVAGELTGLLGVGFTGERVRWLDGVLGDGYGLPTDAVWAALREFGQLAGAALDPVYTGKAAAALLRGVADGSIGRAETVVFVHTGGLPGLYGYADEFAAAVAAPRYDVRMLP